MKIPAAMVTEILIEAEVVIKGVQEIVLIGNVFKVIRNSAYCTAGIYHRNNVKQAASYDDIILALAERVETKFQGSNADTIINFRRAPIPKCSVCEVAK